ncbi:GIY-YIG nuclease family protein [bacterium]|nr:GIY-YIG nuclease family protein [bacterium]
MFYYVAVNYTVYILYSEKDNGLYVGCTSNLSSRIARHTSGGVLATKLRLPVHLIHSENFADKALAFNRERSLKSLWGAREKSKIKRNYLKDSFRG